MTKNLVSAKASAAQVVKDILRAARKPHSSEEKIRIVLSVHHGSDDVTAPDGINVARWVYEDPRKRTVMSEIIMVVYSEIRRRDGAGLRTASHGKCEG